MSLGTVVNNIVDEKMKNLHCAFLAKVLSVSGGRAKIQPLGLTKQYGGEAQKQSVITGVYIAQSARYKFTTKTVTYAYNADGDTRQQTVAVPSPISVGDVVLCVCCDRNIDGALKGENVLPPIGFHKKSDCVIVSII